MRIFIKGGVWKNTEDEILKAAVMKYGKNQWSRISSLLVRKSAKQCKTRWYEWIDPSIKKTEWTREEDEKLLHLAKLMPNQWRTIAPIVGRTAAFCLERYERLLDQASGRDGELDPADDPRRLRPGEIDPHPENKPARPDPIDMDEDEKEMIQEARARMVNTQGKKAKRKAREKQLEEARRLASLQKRRELKAAGIVLPTRRRRKDAGVDYINEVPFEKAVPVGFYAVDASETPAPFIPDFKTATLQDVDERGRRPSAEDEERKAREAKRAKLKKEAASGKETATALLQASKVVDPITVRRRTLLTLSAPQMSDRDLEEIVRFELGARAGAAAAAEGPEGDEEASALMMGRPSGSSSSSSGRGDDGDDDGGDDGGEGTSSGGGRRTGQGGRAAGGGFGVGGGGGGGGVGGRTATSGLVGSYKAPSSAVPLRTPRTPASTDYVMQEAQNILALNSGATPLIGGVNAPLSGGKGTGDFAGVTPARKMAATPNVHMTPSRSGGGVGGLAGSTPGRTAGPMTGGSTPARGGGGGGGGSGAATAARTPLRDMLAINAESGDADYGGSEAERQDRMKRQLKARLAALPAPTNSQFEIVMPAVPEDEDDDEAGGEAGPTMVDAADLDAQRAERQRAKEEARLARRSAAIRRDLPRPLTVNTDCVRSEGTSGLSGRGLADELVRQEMLLLFKADYINYPVGGTVPQTQLKIEAFSDELLSQARSLIESETEAVKAASGHGDILESGDFEAVWKATSANLFFNPNSAKFGLVSKATPAELITSLQNELDVNRRTMGKEAKKAGKLEQRVALLTTGYQMRADKLRSDMRSLALQTSDAKRNLECYRALAIQEGLAIPRRLENAEKEVAEVRQLEKDLQKKYKALREDLASLMETR